MKHVSADRERAVEAALRRFPQFELTINRLMDRAESFRAMCRDLADAELALAKVENEPAGTCKARRAEWEALVDQLSAEVETELRGCDPTSSPAQVSAACK